MLQPPPQLLLLKNMMLAMITSQNPWALSLPPPVDQNTMLLTTFDRSVALPVPPSPAASGDSGNAIACGRKREGGSRGTLGAKRWEREKKGRGGGGGVTNAATTARDIMMGNSAMREERGAAEGGEGLNDEKTETKLEDMESKRVDCAWERLEVYSCF
jgi:hypothetical protein